MDKQFFLEFLKQEIRWHENEPAQQSGVTEDFKAGFIKGLVHVKDRIEEGFKIRPV
jgi:hypothetical protein